MTQESDRALLQEALEALEFANRIILSYYQPIEIVEKCIYNITKILEQPAALPEFEDPRVQAVYRILCEDERPPEGEHWEGFAARKIVAALEQLAAQPVAIPAGYKLQAESTPMELLPLPEPEFKDVYYPDDFDDGQSGFVNVGSAYDEAQMESYARANMEKLIAALNASTAVTPAADIERDAAPIAKLVGVDEYGPRLKWHKHWVNIPVGTEFYTGGKQ